MWLIFLNVSAVDVLVEARQSEEVKLKKRVGPQFLTYTWVGINLGQIVSVVMIGPLIQMFGPHVPYLVAAPFIILVLWPTLANFLGERQLPVEERGQHMRVLLKHPVLCALTLAIGCLVLSLVVGTFLLPRTRPFHARRSVDESPTLSRMSTFRAHVDALVLIDAFGCAKVLLGIRRTAPRERNRRRIQKVEGFMSSLGAAALRCACSSWIGLFLGVCLF